MGLTRRMEPPESPALGMHDLGFWGQRCRVQGLGYIRDTLGYSWDNGKRKMDTIAGIIIGLI